MLWKKYLILFDIKDFIFDPHSWDREDCFFSIGELYKKSWKIFNLKVENDKLFLFTFFIYTPSHN